MIKTPIGYISPVVSIGHGSFMVSVYDGGRCCRTINSKEEIPLYKRAVQISDDIVTAHLQRLRRCS